MAIKFIEIVLYIIQLKISTIFDPFINFLPGWWQHRHSASSRQRLHLQPTLGTVTQSRQTWQQCGQLQKCARIPKLLRAVQLVQCPECSQDRTTVDGQGWERRDRRLLCAQTERWMRNPFGGSWVQDWFEHSCSIKWSSSSNNNNL